MRVFTTLLECPFGVPASFFAGTLRCIRKVLPMTRHFSDIAFTTAAKAEQERHGSRRQYQRLLDNSASPRTMGDSERRFIAARDGFYMSSVIEDGWPYIQFRGGSKGFLHVIDDVTLGFADLSGNRQYITVGNLRTNDRVALFLMDYVARRRLKVLGHAAIHEGTAEAAEWIRRLRPRERGAAVERAILIRVEAFDWNCPQHIPQRFTIDELSEHGLLEPST